MPVAAANSQASLSVASSTPILFTVVGPPEPTAIVAAIGLVIATTPAVLYLRRTTPYPDVAVAT